MHLLQHGRVTDISSGHLLRAEAAARLTEEYTRRVVEALESMASREERAAVINNYAQFRTRAPVRWSLRNEHRSRYVLENLGDVTAEDVEITAHKSLALLDVHRADVGPKEAISFIAAPSMATMDRTITVQWTDGDQGERRTWKYPLPPEAR